MLVLADIRAKYLNFLIERKNLQDLGNDTRALDEMIKKFEDLLAAEERDRQERKWERQEREKETQEWESERQERESDAERAAKREKAERDFLLLKA